MGQCLPTASHVISMPCTSHPLPQCPHSPLPSALCIAVGQSTQLNSQTDGRIASNTARTASSSKDSKDGKGSCGKGSSGKDSSGKDNSGKGSSGKDSSGYLLVQLLTVVALP